MKSDKFAPMVIGLIAVALAVFAVYRVAGVFVDVSDVFAQVLDGTAAVFGVSL